jgi:hypothetical protein
VLCVKGASGRMADMVPAGLTLQQRMDRYSRLPQQTPLGGGYYMQRPTTFAAGPPEAAPTAETKSSDGPSSRQTATSTPVGKKVNRWVNNRQSSTSKALQKLKERYKAKKEEKLDGYDDELPQDASFDDIAKYMSRTQAKSTSQSKSKTKVTDWAEEEEEDAAEAETNVKVKTKTKTPVRRKARPRSAVSDALAKLRARYVDHRGHDEEDEEEYEDEEEEEEEHEEVSHTSSMGYTLTPSRHSITPTKSKAAGNPRKTRQSRPQPQSQLRAKGKRSAVSEALARLQARRGGSRFNDPLDNESTVDHSNKRVSELLRGVHQKQKPKRQPVQLDLFLKRILYDRYDKDGKAREYALSNIDSRTKADFYLVCMESQRILLTHDEECGNLPFPSTESKDYRRWIFGFVETAIIEKSKECNDCFLAVEELYDMYNSSLEQNNNRFISRCQLLISLVYAAVQELDAIKQNSSGTAGADKARFEPHIGFLQKVHLLLAMLARRICDLHVNASLRGCNTVNRVYELDSDEYVQAMAVSKKFVQECVWTDVLKYDPSVETYFKPQDVELPPYSMLYCSFVARVYADSELIRSLDLLKTDRGQSLLAPATNALLVIKNNAGTTKQAWPDAWLLMVASSAMFDKAKIADEGQKMIARLKGYASTAIASNGVALSKEDTHKAVTSLVQWLEAPDGSVDEKAEETLTRILSNGWASNTTRTSSFIRNIYDFHHLRVLPPWNTQYPDLKKAMMNLLQVALNSKPVTGDPANDNGRALKTMHDDFETGMQIIVVCSRMCLFEHMLKFDPTKSPKTSNGQATAVVVDASVGVVVDASAPLQSLPTSKNSMKPTEESIPFEYDTVNITTAALLKRFKEWSDVSTNTLITAGDGYRNAFSACFALLDSLMYVLTYRRGFARPFDDSIDMVKRGPLFQTALKMGESVSRIIGQDTEEGKLLLAIIYFRQWLENGSISEDDKLAIEFRAVSSGAFKQ